jgi:hypothetical protein
MNISNSTFLLRILNLHFVFYLNFQLVVLSNRNVPGHKLAGMSLTGTWSQVPRASPAEDPNRTTRSVNLAKGTLRTSALGDRDLLETGHGPSARILSRPEDGVFRSGTV